MIKYYVDADYKLLRSAIIRTNRDHNQIEIAESWLFNDNNRFQLHSIAEQQMDE